MSLIVVEKVPKIPLILSLYGKISQNCVLSDLLVDSSADGRKCHTVCCRTLWSTLIKETPYTCSNGRAVLRLVASTVGIG